MTTRISASLAILFLSLHAQDAPPRAARSVHLWWTAPEATLFYHEMAVEESVPGSYFMACGWNTGYFGIQELRGKDDKIVLFSVWDPTKGDDPNIVPADRRVEVLRSDPDAKIGRFGGEGTGAQCKYPYAWKTGERCRFLLRAAAEDQKTAYTAWFYRNDTKEWKLLASFRALTKGSILKGYYSFVEDFRRDGKSPQETRRARFGNGWVRKGSGEWLPITRSRFTADGTPLLTIEAAVAGPDFTLATGGETRNTTKLNSDLALPEAKRSPPQDLPRDALSP
jgi:hypothetical protein